MSAVAASLVPTDLIRRYGGAAPRYTSYPTALQFSDRFDVEDLGDAIAHAGDGPLSVYVHVPFCSSPCFYCGCTRTITRQPGVIEAYVQRLLNEIGLYRRLFDRPRRIHQLHFGGGTPTTLDDGQFGRILSALDHAFGLDGSATREFSIEIDPRTLEDDTLRLLWLQGFNRVSFGVQDFDPEVQSAINRVQPAWQTWQAIARARDAGFQSVSLDLIYGLPRQTPESFARTLDEVVRAGPDRIAIYAYAHMPSLFRAQRKIRLDELPDADTRIALQQASIAQLTDAGYVYIGMDHFARPDDDLARALADGSLQRNFQGYSTQGGCDLLGLGMSAISRIGDCYSQNTKDLGRYAAAIDNDRLPVERGLRLSAEDRLRRQVIEDLMCRGRVDTEALGRHFGMRFDQHFAPELARLQPLEADGLVSREAGQIRVTDSGRLLVRKVAQVFDAYAAPASAGAAPRHASAI